MSTRFFTNAFGRFRPTPLAPPSAPLAVAAASATTSATVTWLPPPVQGSSPITGYIVTTSPGAASAVAPPSARTTTITGLTTGTAYTFTVQAVNYAGTSATTGAKFPSRLTVANNRLIDASNFDIGTLGGFNVLVAPTPTTSANQPATPSNAFTTNTNFYWSASDYAAMAALGARLVRHTIFWDVFEPDTLNTSSAHGIFDTGAITALDIAIANARAAGMYTVLSLPHLLPGREPEWAVTAGGHTNGGSPAASTNMLADWQSLGQPLTAYIAARYGTDPSVIGCDINEPPASDIGAIMTCYQSYVPWWQAAAPLWPVWVSWSGFGAGTPSPASGTKASAATLLALDTHNRGCIFSWHDYLNSAGTYGTYQLTGGTVGAIAPVDQAPGTFTAEFHGWGDAWTYPNTSSTRSDFAAAAAPQTAFASSEPTFALAINEFGMDTMGGSSNETAWVADKMGTYRVLNPVTQLWWNYDTSSIASNGFSARPSGTWRPSLVTWAARYPLNVAIPT